MKLVGGILTTLIVTECFVSDNTFNILKSLLNTYFLLKIDKKKVNFICEDNNESFFIFKLKLDFTMCGYIG